MIGITDPSISSFENCANQHFPEGMPSNDHSSTTLLHSPEPRFQEVPANNVLDSGYSNATTHCNTLPTSSIKHEPRESELIRLLKKSKATEATAKPVTCLPHIQPLIPEQTQTVILPTTTTTIPIQPALPVQTQKLVISSQPSTVQICPIYPRQLEENQNPQALLTIPG
jgi:hypothetical protein